MSCPVGSTTRPLRPACLIIHPTRFRVDRASGFAPLTSRICNGPWLEPCDPKNFVSSFIILFSTLYFIYFNSFSQQNFEKQLKVQNSNLIVWISRNWMNEYSVINCVRVQVASPLRYNEMCWAKYAFYSCWGDRNVQNFLANFDRAHSTKPCSYQKHKA